VGDDPQAVPKVTNNAANETTEQRTAVFLLMINSGRAATLSHLSEVEMYFLIFGALLAPNPEPMRRTIP